MEWLHDMVLEVFHNARVTYAFAVVVMMAALGTLIGLSVDFLVRAAGVKLDRYTDNHTG
jgi:hypothetical protein